MDSQNHTIKKSVIELKIYNEEKAFLIQQKFTDMTKKFMRDDLDTLFDGVAANDQFLKIDRLEIDLGNIPICQLDATLKARLRDAIQERLKKVGRESVRSEAARLVIDFENKSGRQWVSSKENIIKWIVHFLETGTFPWWAPKKEFEHLEEEVKKLLNNERSGLREQLGALFQINQISLKRFCSQFCQDTVIKMIKEFSGPHYYSFAEWCEFLNSFMQLHYREILPASINKHIQFSALSIFCTIKTEKPDVTIWLPQFIAGFTNRFFKSNRDGNLELLQSEVEKSNLKKDSSFLAKVIMAISKQDIIQQERVDGILSDSYKQNSTDKTSTKTKKSKSGSVKRKSIDFTSDQKTLKVKDIHNNGIKKNKLGLIEVDSRDIKRLTNLSSSDIKNKLGKSDSESEMAKNILSRSDKQFPEININKVSIDDSMLDYSKGSKCIEEYDDRFNNSTVSEGSEKDYFINNCGLVLFAPFISQFFKELRVTHNNLFINENVKHKAIHVLQYLVTGKENTGENELVLNKILCNTPVGYPIEKDFVLNENDIVNSIDLLNSVIKHWDVLKGTSIEGLRESFLQREGKLVYNDSGWKLMVEYKTIDILLTKLPWGFSIIKMPWNNYLLHVQW